MYDLQFNKGCPVIGSRNKVKDELAYLAILATTSGSVCNKSIINIGCGTPNGLPYYAKISGTKPPSLSQGISSQSLSNDRGVILIRSFFSKRANRVLDICVYNTDSPSVLCTSLMKYFKTTRSIRKLSSLSSVSSSHSILHHMW